MNSLSIRINNVINNVEPEFRIPILNALTCSDGTYLSFHSELVSQTWDHPELPIDTIINEICWDVA
jgi:hypothetical protein